MFLGTPDFAVPTLDALAELHKADVIDLVCVVTQPDRPGDRGKVTESPVKKAAMEWGLPILQPPHLRSPHTRDVLAFEPQLLVWAAYGVKIPRLIMLFAGNRALNVHASLLPRWRGASPIAHAIRAGDAETGVTLMQGVGALDAGPVLAVEKTPIDPQDDVASLTDRLAEMGAEMLRRELPRYLAGELPPTPQDDAQVTWAPKLASADGELDWSRPAEELHRLVRSVTPQPGAFTTFRGQRLGVARVARADGRSAPAGTVDLDGGTPRVATVDGWLELHEVRPSGKRGMPGADWARGARLEKDARLPS